MMTATSTAIRRSDLGAWITGPAITARRRVAADDSQDAEAAAGTHQGSRKACTSATTSRACERQMMLAWAGWPVLLAWNMPRTPLS